VVLLLFPFLRESYMMHRQILKYSGFPLGLACALLVAGLTSCVRNDPIPTRIVWSEDELISEGFTSAFVSPNNSRTVAAGANGQIHVAITGNTDYFYDIYYRKRTAGGWDGIEQVSFTGPTSSTPCLVLDRDHTPHVVWADKQDGNFDIYFSSKVDGRWVTAEKVAADAAASLMPAVACTDDGKLHVVWESRESESSRVLYAYRSRGKWARPVCLSLEGTNAGEPAVWSGASTGASGRDRVYVVWSEKEKTTERVVFRELSRGNWKGIVRLSSGAHSCNRPALCADGAGNVRVAWEDHRFQNPAICYRERIAGKWQAEVLLTDGSSKAFRPVVESSNGQLICVAWYDDRWGPTEAACRTRDNTGWQPVFRVTETLAPTYFVALDLDDRGGVHLLFQDRRRGTYDVYYKRGNIVE
jgi:hypothetical protein